MINTINPVLNTQEARNYTSQLLTALSAGNVSAFTTLYDSYIHILYNYGCRLTSDHEMLKDCIHDVFVKLYTKRHELCKIDNFKSYLFISLKNRICDEMRRGVFSSDLEVENLSVIADENVEEDYLHEEMDHLAHTQIQSLLGQLSPRQREALTLYYIEEKKYEDICDIMNINYQSVRNLMHRGLSRLKELAL